MRKATMGAMAALLLGFFAGPVLAEDAAPAEATVAAEAAAVAPAPKQATYIGEQACITCHEVENNNFTHTLHSKVFRENPRTEKEKLVCEACHGPGSLHAKKTKDKTLLIGFSKTWGTPVDKMNGQCLSCHNGGNRINWESSIHQKNKLGCSDCHNPMAKFSSAGLFKKQSITETCETCHQQQRAEFNKKSHMPVHEGKMTCADCHNPHGSSGKRLLKADSVNEVCYTCHAEKRGPYLWEHAPVRENCLNCHFPHGSNNDKMLVQTRPFLCAGCHSTTGAMGHQVWGANTLGSVVNGDPTLTGGTTVDANGAIVALPISKRMTGRSCSNCHSAIHGSNAPGGARLQR